MKIRELFEAPTPITPAPISRGKAEKIFKSKGKQLGRGLFGKAYEIPKDVSTVVKVSDLNQDEWDQDGYYNYIEAIKDIKDETHNPYLPQIYEIRRMKSKRSSGGSKNWLVVNIEKLYPADDLSPEQLLFVLQNILGRELTDKEIKRYEKTGEYVIRHVISDTLEDYAYYSNKNRYSSYKIDNLQLLEALEIIKQLNGRGFTVDIHSENYMFRLTPYGPQLVLTDPLSFRSDRVKIFTKVKK